MSGDGDVQRERQPRVPEPRQRFPHVVAARTRAQRRGREHRVRRARDRRLDPREAFARRARPFFAASTTHHARGAMRGRRRRWDRARRRRRTPKTPKNAPPSPGRVGASGRAWPAAARRASSAANADDAARTFSPYAWTDPRRIRSATSASVWYEYPSSMDARSDAGEVSVALGGVREDAEVGVHGEVRETNEVANGGGGDGVRNGARAYVAAGQPPLRGRHVRDRRSRWPRR